MHEFHIFYSHAEWNFFFALLGLTLFCLGSAKHFNNNRIKIIIIIQRFPSEL